MSVSHWSLQERTLPTFSLGVCSCINTAFPTHFQVKQRRRSPLPNSWMEAAKRNQSRCRSFPAAQMSGIPQTPTQTSATPCLPWHLLNASTSWPSVGGLDQNNEREFAAIANANGANDSWSKVCRRDSSILIWTRRRLVGKRRVFLSESLTVWSRWQPSPGRRCCCWVSSRSCSAWAHSTESGASQHCPVKIQHKSHRFFLIF